MTELILSSGEAFYEVAPTLLVLCLRIIFHRYFEISATSRRNEAETKSSLSNSDYHTIYSLMPHGRNLPRNNLEENARLCLVTQFYMEFFEDNYEDKDKRDLAQWLDISVLFRHLCQTQANVYAIYEIAGTHEESAIEGTWQF